MFPHLITGDITLNSFFFFFFPFSSPQPMPNCAIERFLGSLSVAPSGQLRAPCYRTGGTQTHSFPPRFALWVLAGQHLEPPVIYITLHRKYFCW